MEECEEEDDADKDADESSVVVPLAFGMRVFRCRLKKELVENMI